MGRNLRYRWVRSKPGDFRHPGHGAAFAGQVKLEIGPLKAIAGFAQGAVKVKALVGMGLSAPCQTDRKIFPHALEQRMGAPCCPADWRRGCDWPSPARPLSAVFAR